MAPKKKHAAPIHNEPDNHEPFSLAGSVLNLALARYVNWEETDDDMTEMMLRIMTAMNLSPMFNALWNESTEGGRMTRYAFRHAAARIFLAGALFGGEPQI
jgi:hypothetical protein